MKMKYFATLEQNIHVLFLIELVVVFGIDLIHLKSLNYFSGFEIEQKMLNLIDFDWLFSIQLLHSLN